MIIDTYDLIALVTRSQLTVSLTESPLITENDRVKVEGKDSSRVRRLDFLSLPLGLLNTIFASQSTS